MMKTVLLGVAAAVFVSLAQGQGIAGDEHPEIGALFETLAQAVEDRDMEKFLGCYSKSYSSENPGSADYASLGRNITGDFARATSSACSITIKDISVLGDSATVLGSMIVEAVLNSGEKESTAVDPAVWRLAREDGMWKILEEKWTVISRDETLIQDTAPPVISVTVTPSVLWPPDHRMVTVTPEVSAGDGPGRPAPAVSVPSIVSNEPQDAAGSGDTAPDWRINSDGTIALRAERSGNSGGRVYAITYTAVDAAGNAASATATVAVP